MSSVTRKQLVYALMEVDDLTIKQAENFATELFEVVDKNRFSHSGLSAHDGYVEHSHEVRPDHDGVGRDVPDNCTHGFDANGEYTVRPVRTRAEDIAQAKAMRAAEARESTRPVTLAEFEAQNTMQGLTITGIIEELEALRAQVVVLQRQEQVHQTNIEYLRNDIGELQRQVANGPNAPYTN
jgi:hypothetical protein